MQLIKPLPVQKLQGLASENRPITQIGQAISFVWNMEQSNSVYIYMSTAYWNSIILLPFFP